MNGDAIATPAIRDLSHRAHFTRYAAPLLLLSAGGSATSRGEADCYAEDSVPDRAEAAGAVGTEQAGDPGLLRQQLRLQDARAAPAARAAGSPIRRTPSPRNFIRLSFAEQPGTLEPAVDRLAAAWELHAETLATSPARG